MHENYKKLYNLPYMSPIDRFSGHADLYAQYRIDYPTELYEFVLTHVNERKCAWDCATGNGQVAGALADFFQLVNATDISDTQLAYAIQRPNIHYQVSPAEQSPFDDETFDLITVAQAIHWFDIKAFHEEVRRVAKPNATLAEWGYGLVKIGEDLDPILVDFYRNRVGPHWDPQRKYIDDAYTTLPFPFTNVQRAEFKAEKTWTLDRFLNYLRTWSAVRQYIHENEEDPVKALAQELIPLWGEGERTIRFPIFLRVGRI